MAASYFIQLLNDDHRSFTMKMFFFFVGFNDIKVF